MAYKCRICGSNDVENQGDICELCAIGQDPYAVNMSGNQKQFNNNNQVHINNNSYNPKRSGNRKVLLNGGTSMTNRDPYGNDMTSTEEPSTVQVFSAGQTPVNSQSVSNSTNMTVTNISKAHNQPLTNGVTKNITVDNQKKSILTKWFRALFMGIPFTLDDDVTMFQVFPDFTGTSLNAVGNACDQVIVYGRLNNGAISENNDVEVYGRRDSNNNIIAKTIRNKASGTTISAMRTINTGIVWMITVMVLCLIIGAVMGLGVEGIIWTVVLILCLTNLPKVIKIAGAIFGFIFSLIKRLF